MNNLYVGQLNCSTRLRAPQAQLHDRGIQCSAQQNAVTLPHTLLHCRTQLCALPQTAAHTLHEFECRTAAYRTAYCTRHTVAHCNAHDLKQLYMNVYALT
jgi:hypothetical protein